MKFNKRSLLVINVIILLICLLTPAYTWAAETSLEEVRSYLRTQYVDQVSEEILAAPTIDEILSRLGDPYTNFFTAKEYELFISSINGKFSGIGIYLDIVPAGVKVTSVMEGSPAQTAGLQSGDIIIQAGERSLAGMPSEEAVPLIRGPEGTTVKLVVLRGSSTFSIEVTRKNIIVPSIESKMEAHNTGYIDITTFGSDTGKLFGNSLDYLRSQDANKFIVDLRDNGGGYVDTAQNIAGYFIPYQDDNKDEINDNLVMTLQSRLKLFTYPAFKHDNIIDRPSIFLINNNSASASEILSGAVKDYNKALFIGTRSYGKGCMQTMINLSSGDYLKMTIARFTTPLTQTTIHKVGISPDLTIEKTDPLKAANLLLSGNLSETNKTGLVKLNLASHSWVIDTRETRSADNWQVYGEMIDNAGAATAWAIGSGTDWHEISNTELQEKWSLYYPNYKLISRLTDVAPNKVFTIRFSRAINWDTISSETVQLLNSLTGEPTPLNFNHINDTELQVSGIKTLVPGANYWLIVNPGITDNDNHPLQQGVITTVKVRGNN